MQLAINMQLKQFLFDMKKPNEDALIHIFEQYMTIPIKKLYNRMKRPKYKNQWIYLRPRGNLDTLHFQQKIGTLHLQNYFA